MKGRNERSGRNGAAGRAQPCEWQRDHRATKVDRESKQGARAGITSSQRRLKMAAGKGPMRSAARAARARARPMPHCDGQRTEECTRASLAFAVSSTSSERLPLGARDIRKRGPTDASGPCRPWHALRAVRAVALIKSTATERAK